MVKSVKKETRAVKYKTGEFDLREKIDLKALLNELKPKHDQVIEIVVSKK